LSHDEHAQQFTVSRLARLDLLKAMQDGITKSVQGDLTRRDWMRDTKGLLKEAGWWGEKEVLDPVSGEVVTTKFDSARLKLIFDTNTRMANSAGLWERVWRNRSTHPYVRYITRGDDRVREAHRAWANLTLPVDHPFWEQHWPPNGWRCRCRTMSMTQAEYDRRVEAGEIVSDEPLEEFVTWTNKRTGEVSEIPAGVTPGFDYNPGLARARQAALQKVGLEKLDNLPAPIRRESMRPVVGKGVSAGFEQAVTQAYERLPEGARKSIAAAGYEVEIVDRLVNAAPDLTDPIYEQLDGLTRFALRKILVAEQALDSASNTWRAADGARGATVLAHEFGHALDEIHRLAENPVVAAAWRKESAALAAYLSNSEPGMDSEIAYFTQPWPRGALETIAELYALRHGTGTASFLNVAGAFLETREALYQTLDDKGL